MTDRNNAAIIEAVRRWQADPYVHSLTCGNDRCRADLEPEERDGRVVLVCPACGQVQTWIPAGILCQDPRR